MGEDSSRVRDTSGPFPPSVKPVSGANALLAFQSEESEGTAGAVSVEDKPTTNLIPTTEPPTRHDSIHVIEVRRRRPPVPAARRRQLARWSLLAGAAAALTLAIVTFFVMRLPEPARATPPSSAPGHVTLDTVPPGSEVLIGGQLRGVTPLTLSLAAGHHDVVLRQGGEDRPLSLEVAAGAQLIQRVEFAQPPAAPTPEARLSVTTEPPGARVTIDGAARGVSPVTVGELSVGRHKISVAGPGGVSIDRTVTTEAGVTTSVVFSLPKTPPLTAGWLTITAPFEVRVVEGDEVIGTSAVAKIMIPAGSHELELVNPGLGYESHRKVDVEAGQTATVRVDARAPLNVNARPWAEVVIDGAPAGVTPIANFVLPLGNHQVIFRHPTFGERRENVVVTLQGPNRISVDMTK